MFALQIDTSNAAFGTGSAERAAELARILRELAKRLENNGGAQHGMLYDINGNRVGFYEQTGE